MSHSLTHSDYYGYGDEDDGVIVQLELEEEKHGEFVWAEQRKKKNNIFFIKQISRTLTDPLQTNNNAAIARAVAAWELAQKEGKDKMDDEEDRDLYDDGEDPLVSEWMCVCVCVCSIEGSSVLAHFSFSFFFWKHKAGVKIEVVSTAEESRPIETPHIPSQQDIEQMLMQRKKKVGNGFF